jgi:exosortase E/protease (VPEID-CTERM system)
LLLLLLAGEVLSCAAVLDLPTVADRVLRIIFSDAAQMVLIMSLLVALVAVLFGSPLLRQDLQDQLGRLRQAQRAAWFLPVHFISFLAFLTLTFPVVWFEVSILPDHPLQWVIALWTLAGLTAMAFWAANALPDRTAQLLLRNGLDVVLAGVAIAIPSIALARLSRFLWEPLGDSTLRAVHWVLCLLYGDVVYNPEDFLVGTPSFSVFISSVCGGYEGIGLNFFFLIIFLWLFRRDMRWPAVLLLFPIGAALMWLSNVLRIVGLIAIGDRMGNDVIADGFHSLAGWFLFGAVSLGMFAGARRLPFFARTAVVTEHVAAPHAALPYLAPFIALLATMMLTQAFSSDFNLLYPLRFLVVAPILWWYRAEYLRWNWRLSWHAPALGAAVFLLWIALELVSTSSSETAVATLLSDLETLPESWRITWIIFRIAGSVITVPFAEELAFRGYLTRRLIATDVEEVPLGKFTWFSFLISSVLFGLLHGRWLAGTLAGMAFGAALYRRRSLGDAIVAHAVSNALIAAMVLFDGRWALWT